MSGLFEQMDADASAFADIKTEGGSKLSSLIHEAQKQKELQEQHEQAAKDAKKEFLRITRELIPSEMQEMGLERIDVDGNSVTLNQFCYASIPADKKEEAFNFLREIGQDDLIKNEVKISIVLNQTIILFTKCTPVGYDTKQFSIECISSLL